jgi:Ca2+-binding EF-hand superfamily protein
MLPMMQKELINNEDQFHDLRQKFLEADVDYSGFLTIDEFYNCLRSMGADVSVQEVVNLMAQLDVDGD